jgi:hypothetical protein
MNAILLLIEDTIPSEYIKSYTVREYVYKEGVKSDSMIQVAGSYVIPSRHGFLLRESWSLPFKSHLSRFIIGIEAKPEWKDSMVALVDTIKKAEGRIERINMV